MAKIQARAAFLHSSSGALLGAAVLGSRRTPAAAASAQTIRVSMAAMTVLYAPYMIALEKGYYQQEGLQLDVKTVGGGIATPAQIAGSIDINTSGPLAIPAVLRGAAMKVVYTEANHSVYQMWSTSANIKTLKDLKGMQVGVVSRGDTYELATKLALRKAGLPLDWLSFTALGASSSIAPAFIARSLPALVLSNVDLEQARRAGALHDSNLIVDMIRDLPMPYSGICVTDAYLKDHGDVVRGFLQATLKGERYMRAFKPQTMAIVQKYNPSIDATIGSSDYDKMIPILTKDGTVSDDVLRGDLSVQAEMLGMSASQIPPLNRAYDYSIVREVNVALDKSGWKPQA